MIVTEFSLKLDNIARLFISEKLLDYNDDDDTIHQSARCPHDQSSIWFGSSIWQVLGIILPMA